MVFTGFQQGLKRMSARTYFVQQFCVTSKWGRTLIWQIAEDRKLFAITEFEVYIKEV